MRKKILLDNVNKVKRFVHATNSSKFDIDLVSGSDTYLDAKSLLGILSCNYRKPLIIDIHADEEESLQLLDRLQEFIIG